MFLFSDCNEISCSVLYPFCLCIRNGLFTKKIRIALHDLIYGVGQLTFLDLAKYKASLFSGFLRFTALLSMQICSFCLISGKLDTGNVSCGDW